MPVAHGILIRLFCLEVLERTDHRLSAGVLTLEIKEIPVMETACFHPSPNYFSQKFLPLVACV